MVWPYGKSERLIIGNLTDLNFWTKLKTIYLGQRFSVEPFAVWIVQSGLRWGAQRDQIGWRGGGRFKPPHLVIGWIIASWPSLKNNKRPVSNPHLHPPPEILEELVYGEIKGAAGQQGSLSNPHWLCLTVNRPLTPITTKTSELPNTHLISRARAPGLKWSYVVANPPQGYYIYNTSYLQSHYKEPISWLTLCLWSIWNLSWLLC